MVWPRLSPPVREYRSGTTITAGCFVGFDRRFAVRYSFLMSIPAILGANILSLKDAVTDIIWADVPVYLVGVAVAAVAMSAFAF